MADTDSYTQRYAHCDVLVIGAGPAGLIAAGEAAATGARVILCDDHAAKGGQLPSAIGATIAGRESDIWVDETLRRLAALPNATVLLGPTSRLGARCVGNEWVSTCG